MFVHAICRDYDSSDKILPRLSNLLSRSPYIQVGRTPNGNADINHFSVYIEYGETYPGFNDTLTSAYFTHYEDEEHNRNKSRWWKLAANDIDLCLVTSSLYADMLTSQGASMVRKFHPPVDQTRFTITDPPLSDLPIVGVSGFINPSTSWRKGVHLFEEIARRKISAKVFLTASGEGWPNVINNRYPLDRLHEYFQKISILLCTSLVEGNPMPPLEALSCGKKVVIPRNVGLLDDIEQVRGIYRYDRGDVDDMERALWEAIEDGEVDRERLRSTVAPYTPERYIQDHERAFEDLLYGVISKVDERPVSIQSQSGESNIPSSYPASYPHHSGIYYVAYGDPARDCALSAIRSARKHLPQVEIALASTDPLGEEDYFIEEEDVDVGGRHAKTRMYDLAPYVWDYVMYLDADTEITSTDVSFLFSLLDSGWDLVICTNPGKFHIARRMVRPDNKDECDHTFNLIGTQEVIQLNGGVLAFCRNKRTESFFHSWHEEWKRWGKRDQAALLRALWSHPVKLFVLNNRWNTVTRYVENPEEYTAGILHWPMMARRWTGTIQGRSDSKEAWDKVSQFKKERK